MKRRRVWRERRRASIAERKREAVVERVGYEVEKLAIIDVDGNVSCWCGVPLTLL